MNTLLSVEPEPLRTALKSVPENLRPREMFDRFGAEHVSEEVLLSVILRSGTRGVNVVDLSRKLLQDFGSLTALSRADVQELSGYPGVGRVKAQVLKAALELGVRLASEGAGNSPSIKSPRDAALMLREKARTLETEVFWIICLDTKNRLKKLVSVTSGLVDASLVHPREVFKHAIRNSCTSVIVAHNHPSGDASPSPEDLSVTRQLIEAGRIVDIEVLDHIIIGQPDSVCSEGFLSLRESGVVNFE